MVFAKEVKEAENPAAKAIEKEEEYRKAFANPYNAASLTAISMMLLSHETTQLPHHSGTTSARE